MTDDLIQLHVEHLASMFALHRAMKSDPRHEDKITLQNQVATSIGQMIADEGGQHAMRAFIDQFYNRTQSDDAETWLYRRWDGIRLPDGSVWVS
ncbi:hypothetical protein [Sphingobium sp. TCM1]|uniref:hypothetical protein n=1 Tax=Sphingobium sp. TCM1 TaxID=453246 RepID=UPI0007F33A8F|nr:hypothetical protein [Sphingobium sp. TCM1]OAN56938.1 hypothetical protein A7Q26_17740 [Sphingobium sp. TCM1]